MARRPRFEVYENKKGEYAWRFKSSNGRTIASGEGYKRHTDCIRATDILRIETPGADLHDSTEVQKPLNETEAPEQRTLYVVVEKQATLNKAVASYETRADAENDVASRPNLPGITYVIEEATETVIG